MNEPTMFKDPPKLECFVEVSKLFENCDPEVMYTLATFFHAHDLLWKQKLAHCAESGISHGRFMILVLLMNKDQVQGDSSWITASTPAELADLAQISRASVTGLLDSLEKDGFVCRKHDTSDRRTVSIYLTEQGQEFLDKFLPPHFKMMSQLMNVLEREEQAQLLLLLEKLASGVSELVNAESKDGSDGKNI
ncbi:MarR family transcriptional regulator [Coraliomargarita algicola]|uniref:MarR family transcriptional regulator n=1 Tax=Coraliomargarita algicola TaxID=3092156 RepID=A0ABZ0RNJ8_9BACT|nr:MarR family transcriptional regulator [Coraliomargarita sp. J2-16]WPJ97799.1 MarR family transcriptional regulator [Coraliomargarita sp. J2-16]